MKILISDMNNSINFNDPELKNLINNFVNSGNKFIIATDKAVNYVADVLALTDLEVDYYICNDGAAIFDRYFNVVYRKDIKSKLVRPLLDMLEDDNNIIESFIDTSHGFVKDITKCANGIIAHCYDSLKAELLLNKIMLKYPEIHGYLNYNWINIIDREVNKSTAIDYLKENYRLGNSEIYVYGNSKDDIELVQKYNSFASKDCCEDIKKYLKEQVDGLQQVLELITKDSKLDDYDIFETIY